MTSVTEQQSSIDTARLTLRALIPADARTVQRLAGDAHIAAMTDNIPHPYEDGMAEAWIERCALLWARGSSATYAICLRNTGELIGCCGLTIVKRHCRASLGYWVGREHWGNGYCTEAARALVEFGFTDLQLHRIAAMHLTKNPASGAVMRKIGMKHEVFEDMESYTIFSHTHQAN